MARSANITIENNFSKGLITEASGLNFPENSCSETFDCVFDKTGEVYRRPGLAYEADHVAEDIGSIANTAIAEFLWQGVSQNGEVTFIVVQTGSTLRFFRADQQPLEASDFTINLQLLRVAGSPNTRSIACSFASGNGLLFVAHPYCNPFYVEYDEDGDDITVTPIEIKIRDMKGLDNIDNNGVLLRPDERPINARMTPEITYNLLNQGWYVKGPVTNGIYPAGYAHIITTAYYQLAALAPKIPPEFPSEADIWWVFKTVVSGETTEQTVNSESAFFADKFVKDKDIFGSTTAPKGHYILDAFSIDRSEISEADIDSINDDVFSLVPMSTSGLAIETSGYQRPSQIAFYAGRVFYAGVASTGFNSRIYFTQILDGKKNVDKCYQNQDPTAEQSSDLLPTDGGVIEIPDVAKIVKLFMVSNALYVFATNGVWRVSGSEGIGFTAIDFSIAKVSSTPAEGAASFVDVEGLPIWWNSDGIWTFQQSQPLSVPQVVSLTNSTIQDFFTELPSRSKRFAKGVFNPLTRVVQWLYRSTENDTSNDYQDYVYDRILNLDINIGSFYPWTIPATDIDMVGLVVIKGQSTVFSHDDVTVNGEQVTADGEIVTSGELTGSDFLTSTYKYLVVDSTGPDLAFAEFSNSDTYTDWDGEGDNETDYTAYLISGYRIRGDALRKFQSNYIRIYSRNTDQRSSFDFHTRWDYATQVIPDVGVRYSASLCLTTRQITHPDD